MSKHPRERALHITFKGNFKVKLKWYRIAIIVCIVVNIRKW